MIIKLYRLDSSDDRNDSEINHQQQSEFLMKLNEKISEKDMDVSFVVKDHKNRAFNILLNPLYKNWCSSKRKIRKSADLSYKQGNLNKTLIFILENRI